MLVIDTTHKSPNHSSRNGMPVSMIVLHATVGSFTSSLDWLCSPASKVSTHYLIDRSGVIFQLVDPREAAWHAGASQWFDLDSQAIQECSLGVELVNKNTGFDPYPPMQFNACLALCQDAVRLFKIVPDMVTRHLEIAIPAGRKTDPAGFPMAAFKQALFKPAPAKYRVVAPMFWLEDRRPDAPIANGGRALLKVDEIVVIDDIRNGWAHAQNGIGFTLMAGLVPV